MQDFRGNINCLGEKKILEVLDYKQGLDGLPKSDVLKFKLEGDCSVVVRPSGTEPKIKLYLSIVAENQKNAEVEEEKLVKALESFL